jgi:uncharacterized protein (TIGR03083 family)
MDHDRYCTGIVTQTELLTAALRDADLRALVPSCPGWTLGMLLRHIGGGHRWLEELVRTRSTEFLPDDGFRSLEGDDTGDPPVPWLREGATRLAETLREAGPDTKIWTPLELHGTTAFFARRFAHETLVHRADATLATGTAFTVDEETALDAVDEWMELGALPQHFEHAPRKRDVLGPGRTLTFEATDADAAWFVDLTGDVIVWRRSHEPAAVDVRAPLTDLLLGIYRRTPLPRDGAEIRGDRDLLDLWLTHAAFG